MSNHDPIRFTSLGLKWKHLSMETMYVESALVLTRLQISPLLLT